MRLVCVALAVAAPWLAAAAYYPQQVQWSDQSQGKTPLATSSVTMFSSDSAMGPGGAAWFNITGTVVGAVSDYQNGAANMQIWEIGVQVCGAGGRGARAQATRPHVHPCVTVFVPVPACLPRTCATPPRSPTANVRALTAIPTSPTSSPCIPRTRTRPPSQCWCR